MQSAWLEHGPFAFWLIDAIRPASLVELGTHNGFSYFSFCQAVQQLGLSTACYAVDTWEGDEHAGFYGENIYAQVAGVNGQQYSGFSTLLRCRFDEALTYFGDGTVDLLHIDGRHRFEDARHDYETWGPKLSPRGVVLFHDINVRERRFGVWRLWEELSAQYPSFAFLHGHGLGVVAIGPDVPDGLRPLLDADASQTDLIRTVYARLGLAIQRQYELDQTRYALHETMATRDKLRSMLAHEAGAAKAARAEAQAAQARAEQITQSSLWRATRPLRGIINWTPRPARMVLRRGVKALWWAATPHRMPQRLTTLRVRPQEGRPASPSRLWRVLQKNLQVAWRASKSPRLPAPLRALRRQVSHSALFHAIRDALHARQVSDHDYTAPNRPADLGARIGALARRPVFSVVVPLYDTPMDVFGKMTASVLAQWYPQWELILVDDCSPDQSVRDAARALDDPRIRLLCLDRNQGIAAATNHGLAQAHGDYVVFLDHDDELTPDCLFELATCIADEDPDYLYSDEDKIEPDGSFSDPFFKPDWSPDTLMSLMYTGHVSCVRRTLLEQIGGLRPEFDGAQDWDMVLRITETAKRISHVPKVLYHWRITQHSTASDPSVKPYAIEAGRRARQAALDRRGLAGTTEAIPEHPGFFRVRYDVQGTPLVSIIIPSKNNGTVLKRCIETIVQRSHYRNFEIVLIDNGSTDPATLACLAELGKIPQLRIIRHDAPFNYSEINNLAAHAAQGSLLLFLNDDTEVLSQDWLERMAGYAQLDHVGAVGAKLLYPRHLKIQHNGIINLADGPSHAFHRGNAATPGYFMRNLIEYDWCAVTGACLMIERRKFDEVGGFDETFPVAYNDVELCFRLLEHKYFNVICPTVQLIHHESLSRGIDTKNEVKTRRLMQDHERLYRIHPQFESHDPFHNPNLAPDNLFFALKS